MFLGRNPLAITISSRVGLPTLRWLTILYLLEVEGFAKKKSES
jgi:hypothetical protein